jgi:hypothetical protein
VVHQEAVFGFAAKRCERLAVFELKKIVAPRSCTEEGGPRNRAVQMGAGAGLTELRNPVKTKIKRLGLPLFRS